MLCGWLYSSTFLKQKEQLVREFSDTASRVTNILWKKFITLIKESDPENVGVGSELLVNRQKG